MSASDDVAAIAARLTEAQRKALLAARPTIDARVLVPAYVDRRRWPLGLVDIYSVAFHRLTDRGLAVRAHLASASHSEQPRG